MPTTKQTTEVDALFEQSLKLTPEQRLDLGERLLDSVPMFPDKQSEEKLAATVERRLREIEEGTVKTIPGDEAFRIVREDLKKIREERQEK